MNREPLKSHGSFFDIKRAVEISAAFFLEFVFFTVKQG